MIMAFDFDAVRRAHPIAEVIGAAVKLKRGGGAKLQVGCCPFHPDRTPSMVVYPDHFHCFGCGEHGDVIDFVAKARGLNISDAIAFLTGGSAPALTAEDRARLERERAMAEQRRVAEEEVAILEARKRWSSATPINGEGHPYLERKGIAPYGARREGQNLLVPIFNAAGEVQSVQAIPPEPGEKKLFHSGAPARGGRYLLGDLDGGPVIICEGYATGATLQAATGRPVIIAFSKRNIAIVAEDMRRADPRQRLIIAADEDARDFAHDLAERLSATVAVPALEGAEGSDFNDQAGHYGLEDVTRVFAPLLEAPPTPLPLVWMRDVAPVLSGNWIVKKMIPAEGFVTIIGHPGCGKSFLALDLSLHIASGAEWQGRKVRQGLVVYLAAEGQRGQLNRVEAWRRHHGKDDLPFAMIPVAVNLRDREADLPKLMETIEAAVKASGLTLAVLVVDTLNRTFGGGDENGEDMAQYVENTGRLRAHFGATTIVVHHVPKNAEVLSERGHGSLRGAIDTSLAVQTDANSPVRTVKCIKQKDAEDGWEVQFKLTQVKLGEDEDGDEVTSCIVEEAEDAFAGARTKGPSLSPTQRSVYNELLATLEAASVGVPRDIPDDVLDRQRVGKVVSRAAWRERWIKIAAGDVAPDTASKTFRRAVMDLQNKGMIDGWQDHVWATFS